MTADGGAEVTSKGVCWSISQNPTLDDNITIDGMGLGEYNSYLTSLSPNTTYYLRAYATNSEGTSYGEEFSFKTIESENGGEDGDEDEGEDEGGDEIVFELAKVATLSVTEITETMAVVNGEVISDGGAEVIAKGVCWSTNQAPTIDDNKIISGFGTGVFTSYLTSLSSNTTYYVRAFATNSEGTSYGEEISFVTLKGEEISGTINGRDYVDLGLPSGLKWATKNIGAASPSENGDYFAWGEFEPKNEYTDANSLTYQLPLTDISGDENYDAATVNWGSTWRMPTREEMEELRDMCNWIWTMRDDALGYKVVGPNGNQIFIPASGFVFMSTPYFVQQYGYYWTSVSGTDNYMGAFSLYFGNEALDVAWYFRYAGLTVRPVSE